MSWRGPEFAAVEALRVDFRTDVRKEVRVGRGFAILCGLPVEALGLDGFVEQVLRIGQRFGDLLSQNAEGERVGHVVDASRSEATPRLFRSNLELRAHTDNAAVVVLGCWNAAPIGGDTVLTSVETVHAEIQRRRPDLLALLYRGFHCHRRGEEGPGEEPVTPYRVPVFAVHDGMVSCRYQRALIAAGHRQLGMPLSPTEVEALDLLDQVASSPENRFKFGLVRGDVLVLNNYRVLHARTRFREDPDRARRRHLVRVWLGDPCASVPAELRLFPSSEGIPPQPGRSCSYDFEQLYRDDPAASGAGSRVAE